VSAGGDERPSHATRRPVIAGVLVPRGVRAGMDAGRTRAAEGHGRRLILCTRYRMGPISGFANNGDAPVLGGPPSSCDEGVGSGTGSVGALSGSTSRVSMIRTSSGFGCLRMTKRSN